MKRPAPPDCAFNVKPPSLRDLEMVVRKKRNGATPGLNGISYLVYKKSKAALRILHKIVLKVWKDMDVPEYWGVGFMILLAKSLNLDDVSEFRPIAITNTSGKIFFSVIATRLESFLVVNRYIKREIQKGFLAGVTGCPEHSFTLMEAMCEAYQHKKSIVVAWLDLKNAYGSVSHNLIQFALNWYHVPKVIQQIVFAYYETLRAFVHTKEWDTESFPFEIGLFQGCILSCMLFDCVFNLLLDLLESHADDGYAFKLVKGHRALVRAYADDLQLSASTPAKAQASLDTTDRWLTWTRTMQAKPRKCKQVGYRQFRPGSRSQFTPYNKTVFSPYDAKLTIGGCRIPFMVSESEKDPLKKSNFKFLGTWINLIPTKNTDVKNFIRSSLSAYFLAVDAAPVNGFIKLWLYQHYVLAMMSWMFMVHELDLSFALTLERQKSDTLRKWAGIFQRSDAGALYRSRKKFGLGIKSIGLHFKLCKAVYCHLLKYSQDPSVRAVYLAKERRNLKVTRVWKATTMLSKTESVVEHNMKFAGQQGHAGLGNGNYIRNPSLSERRKLISAAITSEHDNSLTVHALDLKRQSAWTHWVNTTYPHDLSWRKIIWGGGAKVASFILNAAINALPTNDLLHMMGYRKSAKCGLCGHNPSSTIHVLSCCPHALSDKRYTWRHDSVLANLKPYLCDLVSFYSDKSNHWKAPKLDKSFVKAGQSYQNKKRSSNRGRSLMDGATDWKILVDFTHAPIVFPPEIAATNLRPDVIIWSSSKRHVILGELTCPHEENIRAANIRKDAKYSDFAELIRSREDDPWTVDLLPFEVGCRGFTALSTRRFLRKLGATSRVATLACKTLAHVAARCSYAIFRARGYKKWYGHPLLILTPKTED